MRLGQIILAPVDPRLREALRESGRYCRHVRDSSGGDRISTDELDGGRAKAARYLRNLVEANPGPLVAVSVEGIIIDANEAGARMSGLPRSELLGTDFVGWATDLDAVGAVVGEIFDKGFVDDVPLTVRPVSGDLVDVQCSASLYRDENGEVVGFLIAARDVTAERRVQLDVAEQADRLQLVLWSARLGLWDWNMKTDEGVVDARFAEILGYELEDLMPSSNALWASMTHPEDLVIEDEHTERHIRGLDEYYDVEGRMRHRDGSWVWVRDRGKIVEWDAEGNPVRMTGTLEDIGEARMNADRLAAAEEQFRLAMDKSNIGMCLVELDGAFIRVNAALCRMLGRTPEALRTLTWQELTHPDDLDTDLLLVEAVLSGVTDGYRLLKRYIKADGSIVWGDLSVTIVRETDGTGRFFISQMVDVTDRQAAEQQLAEREELLRVVLDNSPDPTMRFNADMRIEYVNQVMVVASGKSESEWVDSHFGDMGYPEDLTAQWSEHCRRVFETGQPDRFQISVDSVFGPRWGEAVLAPELAPDGTVAHVVATVRDITRRRRAEEDLLRLATHDTLTGLANRAVLGDELERAMQAAVRSESMTAVLMVDLDRFKNVNDSLGHGTGDELLRGAAQRMQICVRGGDLVARTGGDEFVVVMREIADADEAASMAETIVETFRQPFMVDHQALYTTASVGVTTASVPTSADDLVREADTAMYVAKAEGRDRVVVFNHDLRDAVSTRLSIETDLREALERGQLEVWYQPEVDLATGVVIAVEALLRWRHPTREMPGADSFIAIAEETGLIVPIGEWVLMQACEDAARWARDRGQSAVVVRVNVSARQLGEARLLDAMDRALAASGLDPRLLCIEITETALLSSSPQAHANLEGARARGVAVALDDFGTGYASLAYLREFTIDMLKIDRSFITRITNVDFDRQLVGGILALASQLGLEVTAEGVEHADQAECLRELGCRGVQGYLFSKAVPARDIPAMLTAGFASL